MPRVLHISSGSGLNVQRKRVSTGSVAGGATAAVTITWDDAFADTDYTISAVIEEATAGTSTLRVHHVESRAVSECVVRVVNDEAVSARTGTVHCIAIHD